MKNLPRNIIVKGKKYKIVREKNMKNEFGEELDGTCDKETHTIALNSALKGGDIKSTFLHECLHAVVKECNLNELLTDEGEECIVANMESFIMEKFVIYLK
jgi:hypothetical protein